MRGRLRDSVGERNNNVHREPRVKAVSPQEVIAVTATPTGLSHTRFMQRLLDEAEYVLAVLCRMKEEVSAHPEWFDPDAQERVDEAIVRTQAIVCSARRALTTWSVKQSLKAA